MSYIFDKYEIKYKIASGGMAEIYYALLHGVEGFEKSVALKMIHPHLISEREFTEMFISEATLAARLDHPNIVRVYEFNEHLGIYYLSMEYIKGINLRELIKSKNSPLSSSSVFFIACKILSALDYAHSLQDENGSLNLVHRDVSPQNIMLSSNGEVKLADFGIAKVRDAVSFTNTNTVRGKLHYLSPEQARGEELDARSDLFSLGIVLWEALTGLRYYGRQNKDIYHEAMSGVFQPPSEFNSELKSTVDDLLLGFLSPDKGDRFSSAKEAMSEIVSIYKEDKTNYFANLTRTLFESEPTKDDLLNLETDLISTDLNKGTLKHRNLSMSSEILMNPNTETKELTFLKENLLEAKERQTINYNDTETMTLIIPVKNAYFKKKYVFLSGFILLFLFVFMIFQHLSKENTQKASTIKIFKADNSKVSFLNSNIDTTYILKNNGLQNQPVSNELNFKTNISYITNNVMNFKKLKNFKQQVNKTTKKTIKKSNVIISKIKTKKKQHFVAKTSKLQHKTFSITGGNFASINTNNQTETSIYQQNIEHKNNVGISYQKRQFHNLKQKIIILKDQVSTKSGKIPQNKSNKELLKRVIEWD